MALQDFEVKRHIYEAEIAKNVRGTQITSQFSKAAANYSSSKTATEQLANTLFPIVEESQITQEITAETLPSTQTVPSELQPQDGTDVSQEKSQQ